jgi:hypothetical protein
MFSDVSQIFDRIDRPPLSMGADDTVTYASPEETHTVMN